MRCVELCLLVLPVFNVPWIVVLLSLSLCLYQTALVIVLSNHSVRESELKILRRVLSFDIDFNDFIPHTCTCTRSYSHVPAFSLEYRQYRVGSPGWSSCPTLSVFRKWVRHRHRWGISCSQGGWGDSVVLLRTFVTESSPDHAATLNLTSPSVSLRWGVRSWWSVEQWWSGDAWPNLFSCNIIKLVT